MFLGQVFQVDAKRLPGSGMWLKKGIYQHAPYRLSAVDRCLSESVDLKVTANTALVRPGQKKSSVFFLYRKSTAKPMIFNGFKCQVMASV